ncbi:thrombospondin-1-like [Ruditapes philippinarum]|uniref:thrombospondin-1-like n=1 Tax=Ruditapes philippinarum TaxID=129788 RepID=UPI00295A8C2A|nr:thrombospondin-1-like [Ruditapes philippinarum]
MDRHHAIFLLLVFQICVAKIDSLSCLFCQNIDDPFQCNITVSCQSLQVCFLHEKGGIYNMGCTGSQQCGGVAGAGPGIVGRSVQKKQSSECHECCSTDSCNSLLCQHSKPTSCRNDETVDCAKMNSLFHICADIHQASLVCPQFCNLCGVVDGNWGAWSSWSGCDVTCSTGSQTRFRICSDPAPAGGGLDCVGKASDTKICKNDACPVHGGWSQWTTWGSCSVTCGVGMQRRDRSCSKPYPTLFGDHCFGDSRDDRVCIPGACSGINIDKY